MNIIPLMSIAIRIFYFIVVLFLSESGYIMAVVSSRDIATGEFFCAAESDSEDDDSNDDDDDNSEVEEYDSTEDCS